MSPRLNRQSLITIDLVAIAANYRWLARQAAGAECAACVKADAYGMGADMVGPALYDAGCRSLFVATAAEGAALRASLGADRTARILVLNGFAAEAAALYRSHDLTPVLSAVEHVSAWRDAFGATRPAALQLDTGMARLGLGEDELPALEMTLRALHIELLLSHLACAELPQHPLNTHQLERFRSLQQALHSVLRHPDSSLANSSGILLGPDYHFDLVRPGAALYGVNPRPDKLNCMRPVVHWQAPVLQVRELRRETGVGYGATFTGRPPGRIATVACGYADGYPRSAGNRAYAQIAEAQVPVIGRVSMDLMTIDISLLPADAVRPGDQVTLLGEDFGVDDLAAAADTIGYEILVRCGNGARRAYQDRS